jgi:hypothetical protein
MPEVLRLNRPPLEGGGIRSITDVSEPRTTMTTFLLVSVALLIIALVTTIASLLRAKDGYEDQAGFHPVRHPDPHPEPTVGRLVTRAPLR